jgi:hypothetical protein
MRFSELRRGHPPDERDAFGFKVAHPTVIANSADGFDFDLGVFRNGYRTIGEGDANWLFSPHALVNPRSPKMLTASGLAVAEKTRLSSQLCPYLFISFSAFVRNLDQN